MTSGDDVGKGRRGARASRGRKPIAQEGGLFDVAPSREAVPAFDIDGVPSAAPTDEPARLEGAEATPERVPPAIVRPEPTAVFGFTVEPTRIEGARTLSEFDHLKQKVEAVLFAAEGPLTASDVRQCLGEVAVEDVRLALKALSKEYGDRAFFLFETGGRYQLRTRPEHSDIVSRQFTSKPRNLSKAAIETLCIIAYRQPVTRAEINAIRGTDSASIVAALKDKDLIAVAGQRKEVGSPLEFKTTTKFLEVFGLSSLKELPHLRSLQMNVEDQKQAATALAELDGRLEEEPLTAGELSFSDDAQGLESLPPSDTQAGADPDPVGARLSE